LLLSGVRSDLAAGLAGTGLADVIGADHITPAETPEGACANEPLALALRLLDEQSDLPAPK
jgi:hypothetical protein